LSIWQTTGVQKFDFSDSLINGSLKTFREFNRQLIKYRRQYPGFEPRYKGQFICRPIGQMKPSDYDDMASAGAETIVVGIEHFSESVRTHMGKNFDNAAIDAHFAHSARLGIKNVLLILSGYVTETSDDHQQTMEYLKKYQMYAMARIIYAINIEVLGLGIYEGAPLTRQLDELQVKFLSENDREHSWYSLKNPNLTPRERVRRALEVINVATDLGYKVLHLSQKINVAERWLTNNPPNKKIQLKVV
jgi:hypothetical protein